MIQNVAINLSIGKQYDDPSSITALFSVQMYLYAVLVHYIIILTVNIVMKDHFANKKHSNKIAWFMNIIGFILLVINAQLIFS